MSGLHDSGQFGTILTGIGGINSCLSVLRGAPKCARGRHPSALPHFRCVGPGGGCLMRMHRCFGLSDITNTNSRLSGVGGVLACVRGAVGRSKGRRDPTNDGVVG